MTILHCACGCGREFVRDDTGKGRGRIYFDARCRRRAVYQAHKKVLSTRRKCSVPDCPRRVAIGNHFLCEEHYMREIDVGAGYYDNLQDSIKTTELY